jgi:hypothetical protein
MIALLCFVLAVLVSPFVASDVPLQVSYVQATLLAQRMAKSFSTHAPALKTWEVAVKAQALLATRLRLAPQSRVDPKTLTRKLGRHNPSAYDLLAEQ